MSRAPQRCASAAHAISWIWWNSISGSTIAPTACAEKITFAIGTPAARLFFDPQKMIVIWSARLNPSRLLTNAVSSSAIASNTRFTATRPASACAGIWCHSP